MSAETFVALLVFLFPLAYSPGPGNGFFAAIGTSQGLKAAIPALAGYHVATLAMTALIGLGMGVTILNDPVVAKVLGAAGSIYVLWLAWTFIRAARAKAAADPGNAPEPSGGLTTCSPRPSSRSRSGWRCRCSASVHLAPRVAA